MQVTTKLTFLDENSAKPKYIMQPYGQPTKREGLFTARSVEVVDARALKTRPRLEKNGFEMFPFSNPMAEDVNETDVSIQGYTSIEALMATATGADKVTIFDHTIRSSAPDENTRGTAGHVHVDYTEASIKEKANRLGLATGPGRFMQLNAWCPLREPVRVAPLALGDSRTFDLANLIQCELIYDDRVGEIYELNHNPDQRWFYFPQMRRDEIILFKGYDSAPENGVQFCPHSAFTHPDERPGDPVRLSVEFRAILNFDY